MNNKKDEDYKKSNKSNKMDMIERYLHPVIDNKLLYKKSYISNISIKGKRSLKNK